MRGTRTVRNHTAMCEIGCTRHGKSMLSPPRDSSGLETAVERYRPVRWCVPVMPVHDFGNIWDDQGPQHLECIIRFVYHGFNIMPAVHRFWVTMSPSERGPLVPFPVLQFNSSTEQSNLLTPLPSPLRFHSLPLSIFFQSVLLYCVTCWILLLFNGVLCLSALIL